MGVEKEDEKEFSAERAEYEFEQCMKKYKAVKSNRYVVDKNGCKCSTLF